MELGTDYIGFIVSTYLNEVQVVGGPNSTGEGMNKINTGGKSRENCASQFWPAKLYQRGNISYTQR